MSQPILCPHCRNVIAIKDPRPGRFRIQCPTCGEPFALAVPDEPDAPVVTSTVGAQARPRPSTAPDSDETAEQPARPRFARPPVEADSTEEVEAPPVDREPSFPPPRSLGGYRIRGPLAKTRSGESFRAVRWLLGGRYSIAVVKPRWAADARFVARFAREAFAAAQLRHPNLAPVREIGVDRGLPFAVSDAPEGFPLSDPARGRAGLDRTARVSAILHAGRALRLGHEQGVYHRGLTLEEIRVDRSGLIRLTGLGIGLTPETPEVPAIAAVALAGGPVPAPSTSPAPEPPSATFARDDVAALGRALQALLGGERGDRAVPPGLAVVARRMAGAQHEPPYKDLGAAIRALEAELGVAGPFAPDPDQVAELEESLRAFEAPPMARLRPLITLGSAGLCGLLIALALLMGKPLVAIGALAFGTLTAWSLVKVRGLLGGGDPIFDRARELALGGSRGDALTVVAGVALVVGALMATHLLGLWIFLGVLAGGLATAYHFAVERPIAQARQGATERLEKLLMGLRRQGVEEDDVRRFVARQSGPGWEELYESAFGYGALRSARARWGLDAGGKRRPRFAPWRDPIVDLLDAKLDARRREREQALLQGIEERGAEAGGMNLLTARRKSHRVAEALVSLARQYRRSADASVGLPLMNAMLRATERPEEFLAAAEAIEGPGGPPAWQEALGLVARIAFGPRTRFLVGGAFLAGFLVWMNQNALIDAEEIKRDVLSATSDREQAVANAEKLGRKFAENVQGVADAARRTNDVVVPYVPPAVARRVDGFGLGVAGLILILSSSFHGIRFAAFAVPGALVAAFGARSIDPAARTLGMTSTTARAVAAGLFALGVLFGRGRD